MESNIVRLSVFFEDPAYRISGALKVMPKILNNIAREDYRFDQINGNPTDRFSVKIAFRADEHVLGDRISFHFKHVPSRLQEDKLQAQFQPQADNTPIRYNVDLNRLMTPMDFKIFHSYMMAPPEPFEDGRDDDDSLDILNRLSLRLQEEMDHFGFLCTTYSGEHSFDLQRSILTLYSDYRADMFLRRIENERRRSSLPPPSLA